MNPLLLICRAQHAKYNRYGNINPLSIAYATRLGLGPTNPEMITMAQETLLFRRTGFSPVLWLLIPTFSLPHAPPNLTIRLHRREERSSTTVVNYNPYLRYYTWAPLHFPRKISWRVSCYALFKWMAASKPTSSLFKKSHLVSHWV